MTALQSRRATTLALLTLLVALALLFAVAPVRAGQPAGTAVVPAAAPAATPPASALDDGAAARPRLPDTLPFRRDPETQTVAPGLGVAAGAVLLLAAALALALRWQAARRRQLAGTPPPAVPWRQWLGKQAGDDAIELLGSRQLGPGVRLHVVQWQGRQYLLSNGPHSVTLLDQRPAAADGMPEQQP